MDLRFWIKKKKGKKLDKHEFKDWDDFKRRMKVNIHAYRKKDGFFGQPEAWKYPIRKGNKIVAEKILTVHSAREMASCFAWVFKESTVSGAIHSGIKVTRVTRTEMDITISDSYRAARGKIQRDNQQHRFVQEFRFLGSIEDRENYKLQNSVHARAARTIQNVNGELEKEAA